MKKIIAGLCLAFITSISASAQTGTWTGRLNVQGTELALTFNIGEASATLDVPDQGAKNIPVEVSRGETGTLKLNIPSIGAVFEGVWLGKIIAGTFRQHGAEFQLTLNEGAPVIRRPQTPAGPFPYATEEVEFRNGDAVLKGTLSLPDGCGRTTPVLIMVTGSGLQNRDEEMFSHKPFAVIADAFARAGIATLRYDDRGFGESTGDVVSCTTEDLRNDAQAGIELLKTRFDKVGVLGHSEGGSIALMLAAEGKADFVISLAGMVVSGKETLLEQNRHALQAAGSPESEANAYCELLTDLFTSFEINGPVPFPYEYEVSDALKENYLKSVKQFLTPYMRYFLSMDVSKTLPEVKCPVMALNGSSDTQVNGGSNLAALKSGLPENGVNVIREEPGLNHLFQHCSTGELAEYGKIEETFSPDVISEMISWISGLKL